MLLFGQQRKIAILIIWSFIVEQNRHVLSYKMLPKNQITLEQYRELQAKGHKEDSLQKYANKAINLRRLDHIRFPNKLLWWIRRAPGIPRWVRLCFFGQVAGKLPDNLILAQIAPGCFLAVKMELKTKDARGKPTGRFTKKQKYYAPFEKWFVVRSPEEIDCLLNNTIKLRDKIIECVKLII